MAKNKKPAEENSSRGFYKALKATTHNFHATEVAGAFWPWPTKIE
jgi:hypothetical protein